MVHWKRYQPLEEMVLWNLYDAVNPSHVRVTAHAHHKVKSVTLMSLVMIPQVSNQRVVHREFI